MKIQMALSLVLSLVYLSAEELGHLSEGTFLSFSFQNIQTRHRLLLLRHTESCSNHSPHSSRDRRHKRPVMMYMRIHVKLGGKLTNM